YWLALEERSSEVERQHVPEITNIAQPERIGQAPQCLLPVDHFLREIAVDEHRRWIAGQQLKQREHDGEDAPDHERKQHQPPNHIVPKAVHATALTRRLAEHLEAAPGVTFLDHSIDALAKTLVVGCRIE